MTTTDRTNDRPTRGGSARTLTRPAPARRLLALLAAVLSALAGIAALGATAVVGGHRYEGGGATLTFPVSGALTQAEGSVSAVSLRWVALSESERAWLIVAHLLDVVWVPGLLLLTSVLLVRHASGRRTAVWVGVVAVGVGQLVASAIAALLRGDVLPAVGARLLPTEPAEGGTIPYLHLETEQAGAFAANVGATSVIVGLLVVVAGLVLALVRATSHGAAGTAPDATSA
ncbi:hypothetical protein [Sanguibacter sp. HDW7]|uniref:hypothetical protein n=1 Tax=Sanguibacter sp. HDW7 TaxID=2714931 RepID=UPI0014092F43|nr:hypothetical protein [Sanguibacter sp. HDW7]QIK82548.1 hypothetical protein G7063_02115 [Sanguibacter sp. HDW7]